MARERLSAVLVVRNEAHQIRQCLRSLRFADEVLVVDCGSTDGTPAISRPFADRVIPLPSALGPAVPSSAHPQGAALPPLIHAAKNFAFGEAEGPWILNLDADERLTDALRQEILEVLSGSEPRFAAYSLPFTHYFFGRYLRHGGFRGPLVRLFKKGNLRYPEDRAHSTPVVEGQIGALKSLVVHFNHPRIADFLRKMDLYTSQDAALLVRHGRGGLRDRPARLPTRWSLIRGPLGVFWNRYIRHRGFLDGGHGLVAAGLMAAYQFVESAKLWEALASRPAGAGAGARASDRDVGDPPAGGREAL